MNRVLIHRSVGAALILSGLIIFVLKALSFSDAQKNWDFWASPDSGAIWFVGIVILETVFLVSRITLGYLVYLRKNIGTSLFYPLAVITSVSGLSGILLVVVVLVLRFLQGGVHAAKT